MFTEGLQPAKPERCEAPDVTRNVIVNDALSSRRVRSWRRGGRTRRSERTSLAWEGPRERGRGPSPGGREKGRLGLLEVMLFADQSVLLWLEYRRGKDLQEQDTHGSEVLGGG